MDTFSKMIAVIFAVIVFFLAPLYGISQKEESVLQGVVYNCVTDYVEGVRRQGCITQDSYMAFISELDNTGLLYDVEMEHVRQVVEPVFDETGKVVGTKSHDVAVYEEQILNGIYNENKSVDLDKTDSLEGIYPMSNGW